MSCVFCDSSNTCAFHDKDNQSSPLFFYCKSCGGIARNPSLFLSAKAQKERYLQHHNDLNNEGYKNFLLSFINPVLSFLQKYQMTSDMAPLLLNRILDYGSGPEPALVELLTSMRGKNLLSKNCEIRGWDPFFEPNSPFSAKISDTNADLVTCLEVAEHFESPRIGFEGLSAACKVGGFVAIGTMLIPSDCYIVSNQENVSNDASVPEQASVSVQTNAYDGTKTVITEKFQKWWYCSDKTHVSFYTEEALRKCGENAGLSFVKAITERVFLFKKNISQ